jgi:hypothetical protein
MKRFLKILSKSIVLVALLSISRVEGRVFIVTDTNDTADITSLRGAIITANSQDKDRNNIIILGTTESRRRNPNGSTFYLTIPGPDETNSLTGDLDITRGNLAIIGIGNNVTIDATGLGDRIFKVLPGAALKLENLTITGGIAAGTNYGSNVDGESGGAIYNDGTLVLEHCVVIGNSSGNANYTSAAGGNGGDGGGIYNSGMLTMDRCLVTENICGTGTNDELGIGHNGGNGGGIYNSGKMTLDMCIVSNNFSGQGAAGGSPPGGVGIGVSGGPGGVGGDGGGIYNASEINLNFCTVNGNGSGNGGDGYDGGSGGNGGNGGGIYNSGKMTMDTCIVSNNFSGQGTDGSSPFGYNILYLSGGAGGAGGNGGGIYNASEINLNFCTVNDNGSGNGGNGVWGVGGGNGGTGGNGSGIFNSGLLNLNTCTVSENFCGSGGIGGGGWFWGSGGNGGDGGNGGGIYNAGSFISTSCTVVLNLTGAGGNGGNDTAGYTSTAAAGGAGGCGGGILNDVSGTNVVARNTLIALNAVNAGGAGGTNYYEDMYYIGASGSNGFGFDLVGDFTSHGYNLVGMADGSTGFANGVNADKIGSIASPIDPLIGPLRMNGGFTPTHALFWGSPAIDQGNCFGIHRDQRGHPRPQDFPSIPNAHGGDGSDIGAFEVDLHCYRTSGVVQFVDNCDAL